MVFCFEFVVSICFMIIVLIVLGLMVVCLSVLWIVKDLSCGVVKVVSWFFSCFCGVWVVVMMMILFLVMVFGFFGE